MRQSYGAVQGYLRHIKGEDQAYHVMPSPIVHPFTPNMARFLKLRHGPERAKDRWRCSYSILRSWAWATSSSKAQAKLIAVVEQGRRQLEVQMAQERAQAAIAPSVYRIRHPLLKRRSRLRPRSGVQTRMKTYRIACIPGDGIGQEVVPAG